MVHAEDEFVSQTPMHMYILVFIDIVVAYRPNTKISSNNLYCSSEADRHITKGIRTLLMFI